MMLPQPAVFSIAPLADAVAYPAEPGTFDNAPWQTSCAVGCRRLASRIAGRGALEPDAVAWRAAAAGVARAILLRPTTFFLDEATASLDEPAEAALYHLSSSGLRIRPICRSPPRER